MTRIVNVMISSPAGTPSGDVSLTVDGGTTLTAPLRNGSAAFTLMAANAGDHRLRAVYAAQGDFLGSSATETLHVDPRSITVTADAKSNTYGDSDPGLTYHVANGSVLDGDG